ncbi:hypothetical protein CYLTODRAFT_441843 [Cylindrobasidium torrendii FP15055 ss-10]|uniref:Pre-mRNA-splicing factor CWC24 n=1 Tax=Cylindrobasidium torrendii FP15055 ss-10 TaxID=1314674 RepID=A0A0D7BJ89_9AGAR|nr:hypothetical protein CYLTODRAFT_441843 [Cylindrobasidium torrendii FP15055 ss-10]
MADPAPKVAFFKKSKGRPQATRKRSVSPPASGPAVKTTVVHPSKKNATNLLSAGTKRKRPEDDDEENPRRDGPDVQYNADSSHQQAAMDILAGDELDALEERKRLRKEQLANGAPVLEEDDGQYHGQAAYRSHLKKSTKETPKAMRQGPQKGSSTIRQVTIVDYQPDVCKDYKETGYCGFGDTCKFLHDRGTYLQGWQLDKLAENQKNAGSDDDNSASDSDEEDIPFACLICRKHYTDPIQTRCGHFFCSACAIKRFVRTPKCAACGAATGGMFNRAEKLLAKIESKKNKGKKDGDAPSDGEDNGAGDVKIEGLKESKKEEDSDEDSDDE